MVLPAAIGAAVAVQLLIVAASFIAPSGFSTADWYCQFIASVAMPYAFVWYGAKVAPAHKSVTAIALSVLQAIATTSLCMYSVLQPTTSRSEVIWVIVCGMAGVVASIVGCVAVRKTEDEARAIATRGPIGPPISNEIAKN